MSVSVRMPQLGESVTEGTVTRWLKKEGDLVKTDEPLLEVSTDKVDTEIPSPASGVLRGIAVAEEETVEVGAELAVIDDQRADAAAPPQQTQPPRPAESPYAAAPAAEQAPSPATEGAPGASPQAPAQPAEAPAAAAPPSAAPPEAGPRADGPRADGRPAGAPAGDQPRAPWPGQAPPDVSRPSAGANSAASEAAAPQRPAPAAQGPAAPAPPGSPAPPAPSGTSAAQAPPGAAEPQYPPPTQLPGVSDGPYITPLVRKLAVEHDVDLASVQGTGVGGRIRKQDVLDAARAAQQREAEAQAAQEREAAAQAAQEREAAAQAAQQREAAAQAAQQREAQPPAAQPPADQAAAPTAAASAQPTSASAPAPADGESAAAQAAEQKGRPQPSAPVLPARPDLEPSPLRGTTERMSRLRQVIAQRMVDSLRTSAQLTTVVEADVTKIARLRERAKSEFEARAGIRLTFLPFFALATLEALKMHPKLNAVIDTEKSEVTYHDAEHLGIAVDTERGLLVPVIRNAGDLNIGGLARKIGDLARRTRSGQVSPDELSGGTFTLTNTGSRGAVFDTPIINQPQVAILGTGAVVKRPVAVDDPALGEVIAVRSMVYLALTYDRRLVDGADAARFLATVKMRLEEGAFEAELGL